MLLRNCAPLLAFLPLFGACHQDDAPVPVAHPHYELGNAWQGSQGWFYPYEQFDYRATGLATREMPLKGKLASDGEVWSADGMTGSHQTLQLPAVVTVRNLINGRVVRIRLTRRGPESAGRIIALSPKAADLLGMTADTPVEVTEDEAASRALVEGLTGAPHLDVQSAPVGEVRAESLDGGAAKTYGSDSSEGHQAASTLTPMPVTWSQSNPGPTGLYVLLGKFSGRGAAASIAARCSGEVQRVPDGGGLDWRVRSGPYTDTAQADAALDRTHACGVEGARIIVE
ncbi:MAG: RlpA-like double-psi beta-barrel domain-containing protein [Gluconobacter japonicus]|uniref:septal ring lytic transglycosylase RlpA family protein n=1 Tax=Gluconobacter japonicus TaxID=376620 RepID=UPI0039E7F6DA